MEVTLILDDRTTHMVRPMIQIVNDLLHVDPLEFVTIQILQDILLIHKYVYQSSTFTHRVGYLITMLLQDHRFDLDSTLPHMYHLVVLLTSIIPHHLKYLRL